MSAGIILLENIDRFFALRQYSENQRFRDRLARLQSSQTERIIDTHQHLLANPQSAPAVQFLVDEIYSGKDLRPVANDIRRATRKAMSLLPEKVLRTSAMVLEATLLTQELDEAMVDVLGDVLDHTLSLSSYIDGYRALDRHEDRSRQLALVGQLGHQVDRYVRSRTIQTTFKLVRKPAHAAGFTHLYDFLENGFSVLKPVPSVGSLLKQVADTEHGIMTRLFTGHPSPFQPPTSEQRHE